MLGQPTQNNSHQPTYTEKEKLLLICRQIQALQWTPKQFITAFLGSDDSDLAYRRRFWGTETGWNSTRTLIEAIKSEVTRSRDGSLRWETFIQEEAVKIMIHQSPPSGEYPVGSYLSSQRVQPVFFSPHLVNQRERLMSEEHSPFLFNILNQTIGATIHHNPLDMNEDDHDDMADPDINAEEAEFIEMEGVSFEKNDNISVVRARKIASTVCAMVAFARNRRHNGLQLFNSIRFVSSGVSERVNDYLHLLGLTSSRRTAMKALKVLSNCAAQDLQTSMALNNNFPIGPSICVDNIDMEQRVHTHSIGHRSMMYHGSWGYTHSTNPKLFETLDHSQLTLELYYQALSNIPKLDIQQKMFLPSREEDIHFEAVLKSQIARVMCKYVAEPSSKKEAIACDPPEIDRTDCAPPKIQPLKLQTGLDPEQFCSQLQLIDGDLGTAQNFNSLRSLRTPSAHPEHHLHNISFQLGAAHTLWNIGQSILNYHFGDPTRTNDLGAWHCLHTLGIPSEKVVPKKDFTQMLNNIEKAHEASIFYCIR
ncbi:hypothetical protein PGTUg99_035037 [Puccinia graminis f. sp. tritici]|uniref:DUF6589 domain-containing protein n=1 Tax=Puccinia graminis f. sp. tritici TaxID=56615 RepID=A0A5B0SA11_PUCGR|nr:hypothetical protein PGTUg99_035037 [Puccinia graminis f. sp. tritici]